MKIIMNRSVPGSVDGIRVSDYIAGAEYDLSASPGARSLAAAFVGAGMAEEITIKSVAKLIEAEVVPIEEIVEVRVDGAVIHPAPVKPGKRHK